MVGHSQESKVMRKWKGDEWAMYKLSISSIANELLLGVLYHYYETRARNCPVRNIKITANKQGKTHWTKYGRILQRICAN